MKKKSIRNNRKEWALTLSTYMEPHYQLNPQHTPSSLPAHWPTHQTNLSVLFTWTRAVVNWWCAAVLTCTMTITLNLKKTRKSWISPLSFSWHKKSNFSSQRRTTRTQSTITFLTLLKLLITWRAVSRKESRFLKTLRQCSNVNFLSTTLNSFLKLFRYLNECKSSTNLSRW